MTRSLKYFGVAPDKDASLLRRHRVSGGIVGRITIICSLSLIALVTNACRGQQEAEPTGSSTLEGPGSIPKRDPRAPSSFVPIVRNGYVGRLNEGVVPAPGTAIQSGASQGGQFGVDQFTVRIAANKVPANFDGAAYMAKLRDNPNAVYSQKTQAALGWQEAPVGGKNLPGATMQLDTFAGRQPITLNNDPKDPYSFGVMTQPGHVESGARQWSMSRDPATNDLLFTNTGASVATAPLGPNGALGRFGPVATDVAFGPMGGALAREGADRAQKGILAPAVQTEVWMSQQRDVAASLERTMGLTPGTAKTSGYQYQLPNSLKGLTDAQIEKEVLNHVNPAGAEGQVTRSTSDGVVANTIGFGTSASISIINTAVGPAGRWINFSPHTTANITDAAIRFKDNTVETAASTLQVVKNPQVQQAFGEGLMQGASNIGYAGVYAADKSLNMGTFGAWGAAKRLCGFFQLQEGDGCSAPPSQTGGTATKGANAAFLQPQTTPMADYPQGVLKTEATLPGALATADNSFFQAGATAGYGASAGSFDLAPQPEQNTPAAEPTY